MPVNQDLTYFPEPDVEFRAVHYSTKEDYNLEIGEDFTYDADTMSDEEIREWAEQDGLLDEDSIYMDEDGEPYIEDLREKKRDREDKYPKDHTYPSGRAFLWFSRSGIRFPKNFGVSIVDSPGPGNDWRGVVVKNYDALKNLQELLLSHSVKANFIIEFE